MKDVCFKEAYEKYGQYEDWYRSANYCAGRNCPEYDKCKARQEFDNLQDAIVQNTISAKLVKSSTIFPSMV